MLRNANELYFRTINLKKNYGIQTIGKNRLGSD